MTEQFSTIRISNQVKSSLLRLKRQKETMDELLDRMIYERLQTQTQQICVWNEEYQAWSPMNPIFK